MIDPQRVEELILARLSPATKSPPSFHDVEKSLYQFVSRALTEREWRDELNGALTRLRALGHVAPTQLMVTAVGSERLTRTLGRNRAPQARNWTDFKGKYLSVLIGGDESATSGSDPALRIVAQRLGLPANAARSEAALANAWVTSHLALGTRRVTLDAIRAALLAREVGVSPRASVKEVLHLAASKFTRAKSAAKADIIQALASDWLEAPRSTTAGAVEHAEPALELNARVIEKIQAAARSPDVKRFGSNKAFIASVWRCLSEDPDLESLGEPGFKRLLVEAHQRGAISLSRADLVAAMDPAEVRASETQHLNAIYHFIQIGGDGS